MIKIQEYGILRMIKSQSAKLIARVRGILFGSINCSPPFPTKLYIYSDVSNVTRYLSLGNNVSIGYNCSLAGPGTIQISDNVVLNRNCHINSSQHVTIGPNTLIGPDCYIVDSNHQIDSSVPLISAKIASDPVNIGANVWIGRGATILAGVTIGNHAVIGAGAVVTKNIPEAVVAAGVPAKVIRKI